MRSDTKNAGAVHAVGKGNRFVGYDEGKRIARKPAVLFVAKTFSIAYFREMEQGIREAFREIGSDYELIVRAGKEEDDVDGQSDILTSFAMRHRVTTSFRLTGVILAPAGYNPALRDGIKQLDYADIPIVIVDTNISRLSMLADTNAKIDAIFAANDQMALNDSKKSIRGPQLTATLDHDPKEIGKEAVNALRYHWLHKEVDLRVLIPVKRDLAKAHADDSTTSSH